MSDFGQSEERFGEPRALIGRNPMDGAKRCGVRNMDIIMMIRFINLPVSVTISVNLSDTLFSINALDDWLM